MSDIEQRAEHTVVDTTRTGEAEDESMVAPTKSSRKWVWISASVVVVMIVGAVGAGVGIHNGVGKVVEVGRAMEIMREEYDIYANDGDAAEGHIGAPVCWTSGPDDLPVRVKSYNSSHIKFSDKYVKGRGEIVCGGESAAAPNRRRLDLGCRVPTNCESYATTGSDSRGIAFIQCIPDNHPIWIHDRNDVSYYWNQIAHGQQAFCYHKAVYGTYNLEGVLKTREGHATGSLIVGLNAYDECEAAGSKCHTRATCRDFIPFMGPMNPWEPNPCL